MPSRIRPLGLVVALAVGLAACGVFDGASTAPPASGVASWAPGPAAPLLLTEVAAATHGDRIYAAGGLDAQGRAVDAVLVLDVVSQSWSSGPPLPEPIHHSALVSTPDGLLLVGGFRADGQPTADVQRLDPAADRWVAGPGLPEPRAAGAAAASREGAVYAGGIGPGGVEAAVFRLVGREWTVVGRLPIGREHLAAATDHDGRVFVLGGRRGGLDSNQSIVDVIEGDTIRLLGHVPTPRGGVGAFWWPGLGACLVGGESPGGTHAQVECIDAQGRVTGLPDLALARHGLGVATLRGAAWVVLGGARPGLFVSNAVEVLELP